MPEFMIVKPMHSVWGGLEWDSNKCLGVVEASNLDEALNVFAVNNPLLEWLDDHNTSYGCRYMGAYIEPVFAIERDTRKTAHRLWEHFRCPEDPNLADYIWRQAENLIMLSQEHAVER